MSRSSLIALIALSVLGASASAQVIFPGSTPQGDYLRGVGVAAAGLGVYNYNTAMANSINADTEIRVNEYISAVVQYQARRYAERRARDLDERKKAYEQNLQRIKENPEERDVRNGDTLNALAHELVGPGVGESTLRYKPVPLPVDVVRRIPFRLGSENVVFSMQRLTARGKAKWPPALQDPAFTHARSSYERAVDTVLEQQIEGKMRIDAIHAVEAAVEDLFRTLDQVVDASRDKKLYNEAKNRITEFQKMAKNLLKSHQIELVIGELDVYSGTTVRDLLAFMEKYKLGFADAQTPWEIELYPELYARLKLQGENVKVSPEKPSVNPDR
jgi:vacuolar-type H+-ATPase subunit E/Vma4